MNFKSINVEVQVPIGNYCNITQNREKESCKFCIDNSQGESFCSLFDKNLETDTKFYKESCKLHCKVYKCLQCNQK